MNKPITVQIKETKEAVLKALNESKLHVALLKPIVDEIKQDVDRHYHFTEKQEMDAYQKALKEDIKQETKPREKED
jgi:hypothetical protein